MALKPAKQARKSAKMAFTLQPTQVANSTTNVSVEDADMAASLDQILNANQTMKEDF